MDTSQIAGIVFDTCCCQSFNFCKHFRL